MQHRSRPSARCSTHRLMIIAAAAAWTAAVIAATLALSRCSHGCRAGDGPTSVSIHSANDVSSSRRAVKRIQPTPVKSAAVLLSTTPSPPSPVHDSLAAFCTVDAGTAEDPTISFMKESTVKQVLQSASSIADRSATIDCFWGSFTPGISYALEYPYGPPLDICTADPTKDTGISSWINASLRWNIFEEQMFFRQQAPCNAQRPFFLDVGANIGMHTLAALGGGCSTISFEPLHQNADRMWRSIDRNGFSDRATVFTAGAGSQQGAFLMIYRAENPGASRLLHNIPWNEAAAYATSPQARNYMIDAQSKLHVVSRDALEVAYVLTIDSVFGLQPNIAPMNGASKMLPRHPFANRPVLPQDFAAVKIDAEGFDLAVLHGMRRFILEGKPPVVLMEVDPRGENSRSATGCILEEFAAFMYGAGYVVTTEETDQHVPLSLEGLMRAARALITNSTATEGWALKSDNWYFQRNDSIGLASRGGRPLPPFLAIT